MRKNIALSRVQGETPVVRRTSFPSTVVGDRGWSRDVFMLKIASRWKSGKKWSNWPSRRRRRHLRKTEDQRNRSHLREMNIASYLIHASPARIAWLESSLDWTVLYNIYTTVPALLLTFVCFTCSLIKILYVPIRLMVTIHQVQLSLNVHRIRFSLTSSSIRVWLSGLRLYLQSDRDKTARVRQTDRQTDRQTRKRSQ